MEQNEHIIALSGGVDSSVAAALMVGAGINVRGVMLLIWGSERYKESQVPSQQSVDKAARVAQKINIPFEVLDFRKEFKKFVVDKFINSYSLGLTPNPCMICNKYVRWGKLLDHILSKGGRYIVTGHYARIKQESNVEYSLLRAKDKSKDQTYFLSLLNQFQLKHSKFPLGEYSKDEEVWSLAQHYGLEYGEKTESQDLCFLGGEDYRLFIEIYAKGLDTPGLIMSRQGDVLGEHQGIAGYTIGQRKGIKLSHPEPLYVLEKQVDKNILVVGSADELGKRNLTVKNVNWISGIQPDTPFKSYVKIRYRSKLVQAKITPTNENQTIIEFDELMRDVTPGQFAVFYDGDKVLGGGEIV